MPKWVSFLLAAFFLVVGMLLPVSSFAQSFFGLFGANPSSTANTSPSATNGSVMSPDQFKSKVGSLSQSTDQQMANAPLPVPLQPPPTAPSTSAALTTTAPQAPAPVSSATGQQQQRMQPTAPNTGGQPIVTALPGSRGAAPGASENPSTTQQSQVYTGFGGGSNTSNNTNNNAPAGGGWNIKY